jgi:hypothetical protein
MAALSTKPDYDVDASAVMRNLFVFGILCGAPCHLHATRISAVWAGTLVVVCCPEDARLRRNRIV